ncbi:MAG: hypothetical protein AAGH42_02515 [Pseudomonadota bacterium]
MANYERYSLASLITTGLIFAYFCMRMLDGLHIVDYPPESLFWVYLTVLILFIIAETVNASIFLSRKTIAEDERDFSIKAKAGRNGDFVVMALINMVIFIVLANYAFTEYEATNIDITHPPALFFHLFGILIVGTLVERISALVYYQR